MFTDLLTIPVWECPYELLKEIFRMSKLYIISGSYYPNTASTNRVMGLIKAFSQMGVKCDVVYFMPDEKCSKAPKLKNVTYHYFWKFLPVTSKLRFILYQFLYKYLLNLTIRKDDIVYIYGCDDVLTMLSKRKDIRIYYERTEHTNFSRANFLNYNDFFQACKRIDGLFLISNGLANHFIDKGISKDKIHIINMTVDHSRFKGLVKNSTERYVAYCGTASNNKDGVDELIKAFALVHNEIPELKLYIIGKTPDKSDESGNLRLINELLLNDSIVFTGEIEACRIPQMLKNAEVLALDRPDSIQAQCGFPTKLGEYLLTENPVVVTNVGDIPLFLKDGISARISKERDSQDFADKILWCLNNPKQAAEIGKNGANVAKEYFDSYKEALKVHSVIFKSGKK